MPGGLRNADLPKYVEVVRKLLLDSGLSRLVARRVSPLVTPTLLVSFAMGDSIGAGFFDFLRKNPDLREKIMKIVPEFPTEDRRMFAEIDERAAAEKRMSRK